MRISDWSSDVCSSDLDTAGGWRLLRETLAKRGYLLLPLIVLIVLLARGMTPTQSALYCIVFALAISPWPRDTRLAAIDLFVMCSHILLPTLPLVYAVSPSPRHHSLLTPPLTALTLYHPRRSSHRG